MESNLDKDIKKVSLEENNDNKADNKNISGIENNKEIDNNGKKMKILKTQMIKIIISIKTIIL